MFRYIGRFLSRHRSALFSSIYFISILLVGAFNWALWNGAFLEGLVAFGIISHDVIKDWFLHTFFSTPYIPTTRSMNDEAGVRPYSPFQMVYPYALQTRIHITREAIVAQAARNDRLNTRVAAINENDLKTLFKPSPKAIHSYAEIKKEADALKDIDPDLKNLLNQYENLQENLKKTCHITLDTVPSPVDLPKDEWCLLIENKHPEFATPYRTEELSQWLKTKGINPLSRERIFEKSGWRNKLKSNFRIEYLSKEGEGENAFISCAYLQSLLKKIIDRIKLLSRKACTSKPETKDKGIRHATQGGFFSKEPLKTSEEGQGQNLNVGVLR